MLDAAATVERLDALYRASESRLGCSWVEANVILTVAGARGTTELVISHPQEGDQEAAEALAPLLASLGLRWSLSPETRARADGSPFLPGELCSLAGYERVTHATRLDLPRFVASQGWEGLPAWRETTLATLAALGYTPDRAIYFWVGLCLGYPDQALLDFDQALQTGTFGQLQMADLPACARYGGAQPRFCYRPEHADDPCIRSTLGAWQTLLEGVYASAWHRHLAASPTFQEAHWVCEGQKEENRGVCERQA